MHILGSLLSALLLLLHQLLLDRAQLRFFGWGNRSRWCYLWHGHRVHWAVTRLQVALTLHYWVGCCSWVVGQVRRRHCVRSGITGVFLASWVSCIDKDWSLLNCAHLFRLRIQFHLLIDVGQYRSRRLNWLLICRHESSLLHLHWHLIRTVGCHHRWLDGDDLCRWRLFEADQGS